jgi:hypothetical protein
VLHLIADEKLQENGLLFDQKGKVLKPNPFLLEGDNHKRIVEESEKLLLKTL